MVKTNLLSALHTYKPFHAEEQKFKSDMISFFSQHEDCFERTLAIGHFTASCWLINKTGDKALLTHHAKLDQWLQLGGHCDGNPDTLEVALKEAREESGIQHIKPVYTDIFDIDIHVIPENRQEKAHYHYDVRYLLQVVSEEDVVISTESRALAWVSNNQYALPPVNASVIRMFNKWLKQ